MKRMLMIDRDGTLIVEPQDEQIDSLEKLEFIPGALEYLSLIAKELDFDLFLVSNQDGLGGLGFPEEDFWPAQKAMLKAFKEVGVEFKEILIDRSLPNQNSPMRKPRTGLLDPLRTIYQFNQCFVIGDRLTDMQLAKNLGAKGIWIPQAPVSRPEHIVCENKIRDVVSLYAESWYEIHRYLSTLWRNSHDA